MEFLGKRAVDTVPHHSWWATLSPHHPAKAGIQILLLLSGMRLCYLLIPTESGWSAGADRPRSRHCPRGVMDNALASEAGNTGSIPVGGNLFARYRQLIPWRFTVLSVLPPNLVIQRLSDATDPAVGLVFGTNLPGPDEPITKKFAGRVDPRTRTFRIMLDPFEFQSFNLQWNIKVFLHGRILAEANQTRVSVWIRPDFYMLFLDLAFLLALVMGIRTGEFSLSFAILTTVAVAVTTTLTTYHVRRAKTILNELLSKNNDR